MVNERTRPSIVLRSLGTFEVTVDSVAVSSFPTDKIRALLTYLALEAHADPSGDGAQPQRREMLASLFWPEVPDALALTNLRVALHRLRQTLDRALPGASAALLISTRQTVQLNHTILNVDATSFQALLAVCAAHPHANLHSCDACVARLEQAVDLYHGELLAGFGLPDAAAFEEWLLLRREMLHQQAVTALHSLVAACEQRGDDHGAHVYASRQLALDPYREEAHRQLMQILARRGLRSEALAQFETCRRLLREELGVEPDAETSMLAARIRAEEASGRLAEPTLQRSSPTATIQRQPLPSALTPLTGRADELARIGTLLRSGTMRLLTIMGVGGVGKTRLALAAAWEHQHTFADGVGWVPLASLAAAADPALQDDALATAVGIALGLTFNGRSVPLDTLCQHLAERALLLVLDNCEHLPVMRFVRTLLSAAPQLHIITTSRARLDITGEVLLRLDGLPVPAHDADNPTHYAGVQLFLAHAQRHAPGFGSTAAELLAAARLCRLLEGLPLGIELAARWVGHYSCDEIASEIAADIDFLAVQGGDLPDRHRSLRAVFDYSWAMLREAERQALARLAIFCGSFDRAAAQAIAGTRITALAALVDASLLRQLGVGRYGFHELVRQFAVLKLAELGESAALADRHAGYYMELMAQQEELIYGSQPQTGAAIIRAAADNMREAWAWAVAHGDWARLAQALPTFHQYTRIDGLFHEGTARIAAAAAQLDQARAAGQVAPAFMGLLGRLHATMAYFLERQELRAEATAAAQTAIDTAVAAGDRIGEAYGYLRLGCAAISFVVALSPRETAPVIAWFEHAIGLCQSAEASAPLERRFAIEVEAECLLYLSTIYTMLGQYATACALPDRALQLTRTNGDRMQENRALNFYAEALDNAGRYEQAYEQRLAMLKLARFNGTRLEEYVALNNLSCTLVYLGDYQHALELAHTALQVMHSQSQNPFDRANSYHTLSFAACRAGETVLALESAEQALALVQAADIPQYRTLPLLALGDALHDLGRYSSARDAYTTALGIGRTHQMPSLITVALAGIARCQLPEQSLAAAQAAVAQLLEGQDLFTLGSVWEPLRVAAICYRVLHASGDQRAATLLRGAATLLEQQSAAISDPQRRDVFREQISAHQELLAAAHDLLIDQPDSALH